MEGQTIPSYHDLFVTTSQIERTSIFNLPFNVKVICMRVCGWEVWQGEALLGGEYDSERWLVLDVAGRIIVDSRPACAEEGIPS